MGEDEKEDLESIKIALLGDSLIMGSIFYVKETFFSFMARKQILVRFTLIMIVIKEILQFKTGRFSGRGRGKVLLYRLNRKIFLDVSPGKKAQF